MAKIGFVGLGNMGAPMAQNLLEAGHELQVHDIVPAAVESLRRRGAKRATVETAVKDVDAVITMLPSGQDVTEVLAGAKGLFRLATPGTLFIDCSSIDVEIARSLSSEATRAGVDMIDAPVSGGTVKARDGTLTFMIGGTQQQFQRSRPLLEAMGTAIIHAGTAGSGQAAKICNNMMLGVSMIAVAEAFAMAHELGLDPKTLLKICTSSSSQCWVMTHCHPVPGLDETVPASRDYEPGFTARLMLKDLRLSQNAARSTDSWTPMGARAAELYEQFVDGGEAEVDFSAIIRMIERT